MDATAFIKVQANGVSIASSRCRASGWLAGRPLRLHLERGHSWFSHRHHPAPRREPCRPGTLGLEAGCPQAIEFDAFVVLPERHQFSACAQPYIRRDQHLHGAYRLWPDNRAVSPSSTRPPSSAPACATSSRVRRSRLTRRKTVVPARSPLTTSRTHNLCAFAQGLSLRAFCPPLLDERRSFVCTARGVPCVLCLLTSTSSTGCPKLPRGLLRFEPPRPCTTEPAAYFHREPL
jgi:hypothetical protein